MQQRVVVIGAGVAGLCAALELAHDGHAVTVVERAAAPGGKLRTQAPGSAGPIDAGPTVFTMRHVFEALFDAVGESLADHLTLTPADVLARHAWAGSDPLDLLSDEAATRDAIGRFAGAKEAAGFTAFTARARRTYETLEPTFISASRPSLPTLVARIAASNPRGLLDISPYQSLWDALGDHFADPRMRQLFARYATYAGSSPFRAPATLMLIAHVERAGVMLLQGGMHRLAQVLRALAEARGAVFRFGESAAEIMMQGGRASGVRLASGEVFSADAVIANADAAALATGSFGPAAARGLSPVPRSARSLSALTFAIEGRAEGFPLTRHNVFFGARYAAEFGDIFHHRRLPAEPTLYICAQDRAGTADGRLPEDGAERFLLIVNAPPDGDRHRFTPQEIDRCDASLNRLISSCGLRLTRHAQQVTTPADFAQAFPGTGGALYGPASHGWMASFRRPGAKARLPGLFLAGGSCHPGAGVPMAALSGRLATIAAREHLASIAPSRMAVTAGGMSTRSAMTAASD